MLTSLVVMLFLDLAPQFAAVFQRQHVPLAGTFDFFGQRLELVFFGQVDQVGMFDPLQHLAVGRNRDHVEFVDLPELVRFGHRRTGHPGEFLVHLEDVLQRSGGERLRLLLDRHAFFGFTGLVQPVAPLATFHQSTGELVDDDDLAIFDDVVDVFLVQVVRLSTNYR